MTGVGLENDVVDREHSTHALPLPVYPFGGTSITIEGLEDYVVNEPNTDSS